MRLIYFLNEFPDEEPCELSIKPYREKCGDDLMTFGVSETLKIFSFYSNLRIPTTRKLDSIPYKL